MQSASTIEKDVKLPITNTDTTPRDSQAAAAAKMSPAFQDEKKGDVPAPQGTPTDSKVSLDDKKEERIIEKPVANFRPYYDSKKIKSLLEAILKSSAKILYSTDINGNLKQLITDITSDKPLIIIFKLEDRGHCVGLVVKKPAFDEKAEKTKDKLQIIYSDPAGEAIAQTVSETVKQITDVSPDAFLIDIQLKQQRTTEEADPILVKNLSYIAFKKTAEVATADGMRKFLWIPTKSNAVKELSEAHEDLLSPDKQESQRVFELQAIQDALKEDVKKVDEKSALLSPKDSETNERYHLIVSAGLMAIKHVKPKLLKLFLGPRLFYHSQRREEELQINQLKLIYKRHQIALHEKARELIDFKYQRYETILRDAYIIKNPSIATKTMIETIQGEEKKIEEKRKEIMPLLHALRVRRDVLQEEFKKHSNDKTPPSAQVSPRNQLARLDEQISALEKDLCELKLKYCEGKAREEISSFEKAKQAHEAAKEKEYAGQADYCVEMKTHRQILTEEDDKNSGSNVKFDVPKKLLLTPQQLAAVDKYLVDELANEAKRLEQEFERHLKDDVQKLHQTRADVLVLKQVEKRYIPSFLEDYKAFIASVTDDLFGQGPLNKEMKKFRERRDLAKLRRKLVSDKKLAELKKEFSQIDQEIQNYKRAYDEGMKRSEKRYRVLAEGMLKDGPQRLPEDFKRPKLVDQPNDFIQDTIEFARLHASLEHQSLWKSHFAHLCDEEKKVPLLYSAIVAYGEALVEADRNNTEENQEKLRRLENIVELLQQFGCEAYLPKKRGDEDNKLDSTAYQYANRIIAAKLNSTVKDLPAKYLLPNWPLIQIAIDNMPVCGPMTIRLKKGLMKYSVDTQEKLESFFWRLFYDANIIETHRRPLMTKELEIFHRAQQQLADKSLLDYMIEKESALKRETGIFGRSTLYNLHREIMDAGKNKQLVVLPTSDDLVKDVDSEKVLMKLRHEKQQAEKRAEEEVKAKQAAEKRAQEEAEAKQIEALGRQAAEKRASEEARARQIAEDKAREEAEAKQVEAAARQVAEKIAREQTAAYLVAQKQIEELKRQLSAQTSSQASAVNEVKGNVAAPLTQTDKVSADAVRAIGLFNTPSVPPVSGPPMAGLSPTSSIPSLISRVSGTIEPELLPPNPSPKKE